MGRKQTKKETDYVVKNLPLPQEGWPLSLAGGQAGRQRQTDNLQVIFMVFAHEVTLKPKILRKI